MESRIRYGNVRRDTYLIRISRIDIVWAQRLNFEIYRSRFIDWCLRSFNSPSIEIEFYFDDQNVPRRARASSFEGHRMTISTAQRPHFLKKMKNVSRHFTWHIFFCHSICVKGLSLSHSLSINFLLCSILFIVHLACHFVASLCEFTHCIVPVAVFHHFNWMHTITTAKQAKKKWNTFVRAYLWSCICSAFPIFICFIPSFSALLLLANERVLCHGITVAFIIFAPIQWQQCSESIHHSDEWEVNTEYVAR